MTPPTTTIEGKQYRIVPSKYPPVGFFERVVPAHLMGAAFELEGLTNDRLRNEVGTLALVDAQDRVSGPGASAVMAAFTHVGRKTRFSAGQYGVYYAARSLKTAIAETRFHRERFMARTAQPAGELHMRVYVGEVAKALHDLRAGYSAEHHPEDYGPGQALGAKLRAAGSWGVLYRSVRDPGGECIGVFRPPAVTLPRQGPHLEYRWDGERITDVFEKRLVKG
jgi:hypothetical protein